MPRRHHPPPLPCATKGPPGPRGEKLQMIMIQHLSDLSAALRRQPARQRVAVICGRDAATLEAAGRALDEGTAEVVFVGDGEAVRRAAPGLPARGARFVDAATPAEAAARAVALVREGRADVLMKGLVGSDVVLRAVLDKQAGLLAPGRVLTHLAAAQLPAYGKLLFFTDAAVIPYPTQEQREAQVGYVVDACRRFGVEQPRVALVHCSEKASDKFPHVAGYAAIKAAPAGGRWGNALVDGPLDVRTACDAGALAVKGIESPLGGRADALVLPDIEAGNVFYKTITLFARARTAAVVQGATRPVVLTSRGDDATCKYDSLCMALLLAAGATRPDENP